RKKHQPQSRPTPSIQFIREGEKPSSSKKTKKGLLQTAPSWEMRVDLGRKLHFPQVVQTSLRPDMVIWSEEAKKIILIELTVPWEEGCVEAYERKATKYQHLVHKCSDKGRQACLFPVLAITADPPSQGRCGSGPKCPMKAGHHLMTSSQGRCGSGPKCPMKAGHHLMTSSLG